jgi:hypothetical protein
MTPNFCAATVHPVVGDKFSRWHKVFYRMTNRTFLYCCHINRLEALWAFVWRSPGKSSFGGFPAAQSKPRRLWVIMERRFLNIFSDLKNAVQIQ